MSTPPATPIAPSSTEPKRDVQVAPAPPKVDRLPPWRVLLHNDDVNDMPYVVATIVELRVADRRVAMLRMLEAHTRGCALLVVTHRERAELLHEQFMSKRLKVTIEPE
ncbi:MAG: ATP-dependent Clp protease adaptor ClpS [Phycisphaerales bacterium]